MEDQKNRTLESPEGKFVSNLNIALIQIQQLRSTWLLAYDLWKITKDFVLSNIYKELCNLQKSQKAPLTKIVPNIT